MEENNMPAEIGFSKGVRGLHHIPPGAKVLMPVSIEKVAWEYFSRKAEQRGVNVVKDYCLLTHSTSTPGAGVPFNSGLGLPDPVIAHCFQQHLLQSCTFCQFPGEPPEQFEP